MAAADFCTVTAGVAAARAARRFVSRCRVSSLGAGSSPGRLVLGHPGGPAGSCSRGTAPPAEQISPGKNANCRCTSAAFTVAAVPMGFAVMCQLASAAWAFYAVSVRRLAPLALRLPPDKSSRPCPCLRLVVILGSRCVQVGTPTGDFHPISSRPCWAHTSPSTGRQTAAQFGSLRCAPAPVTSNVSRRRT